MNGLIANRMVHRDQATTVGLCHLCGLPADSQHFDESGIADVPEIGRQVVLAQFDLAPQYCGRFENFTQHTDLNGRDQSEIDTPGLLWLILINNRPLHPYLKLDRIVNPWGFGSFPVNIRLDQEARLEFAVRNIGYAVDAEGTDDTKIHRVGGRIVGRYWYNPAYGDVTRRSG